MHPTSAASTLRRGALTHTRAHTHARAHTHVCSPQQRSYFFARLWLLCIFEPKARSGLWAASGSSGRSNSLQLQRMSSAPAGPSEPPPFVSPGSRDGGCCRSRQAVLQLHMTFTPFLPRSAPGCCQVRGVSWPCPVQLPWIWYGFHGFLNFSDCLTLAQ